ncbi:MAG: gliding motility-associated C-terminal domain-containing protein, partial [Flavobacteriales bacterium]|nr:gliding motility-associated C-terminal domain-containing protein [Flavobacteriales bacterium]
EETVSDEIDIKIISVESGYPRGIPANVYVNGLNGGEPFPTTFDDPYSYNDTTGELSFTAELPTGQTFYTVALTVEVKEYRQGYKLEPLGSAGTEFIRVAERKPLSITNRQIRFVIGDVTRCNSNMPTFSAALRNAADDAWEFDCESDTLFFSMDKPMLANTVSKTAPYDVRIFRGTDPLVSKDQDPQAIDGIYIDPDNISTLGEFTEFGVILHEGIGPGRYVLFFKNGDDRDTWGNLCGEFQPDPSEPEFATQDHVIFTVNEKYKGYVFREDDDFRVVGSQKDFCYPSEEDGFLIDALYKQDDDVIARADSFVFKYRGRFSPGQPASPAFTWVQTGKDSSKFDAFPTITVPNNYLFPSTPLITPTKGFWTIGIGLRYTYPFQGNTIVRRCYGESFTEVDYVEHPRVNTVDIDLCIDEDFPVIKDLVDAQFLVYNPVGPYSPVNYTWGFRIPINGDLSETITKYDSIGGQSDPNDVILKGQVPKDSLILQGSAAFGLGRVIQIKLGVRFPNDCVAENTITVIRQRVDVDIQEVPEVFDYIYTNPQTGSSQDIFKKDTTICEGREFRMSNSKGGEYYRPDYMSRQWYFNGQVIADATSDILRKSEMIRHGRGWYKLVVTKTTEGSVCFGADSAFINLVDNLVATGPTCSIVTFKDGDISQRFFWPVVTGADHYEVRPVDGDENPLDNDGNRISEIEWYEANDTYGIHHWTKGKEVRLYVRAVNNEVEDGTPCKYGEPVLAEACEIIVRPVNIFTPNGDGINDLLRFDLLEVFIGSKLTVFNRWGKELFQSSNYQNNWDGGDLKDGTYFYILDIDDPSGMQDIFKGTFTIVR